MAVHIEIDQIRLESNAALVAWFQRFAVAALAEGQRLAGERIESTSGLYERSFHFELIAGNPPTLRFGNTHPAAIYIEEDTRPHIIEPTPKGRRSFTNPSKPGALRWMTGPHQPKGGGAKARGPANLHFAQKVHHPGTTGQHIVRDAVSAAADKLRS